MTDLGIFGAFSWIMWPVQMKKRLKATVIVLLGLRLVCPELAVIHAYCISTYTKGTSPSLGVVSALLWQEVDMTCFLMSTLVLALKNFLANFDTSLGNERTYAAGSRAGVQVRALTSRGSQDPGKVIFKWQTLTSICSIDRKILRTRQRYLMRTCVWNVSRVSEAGTASARSFDARYSIPWRLKSGWISMRRDPDEAMNACTFRITLWQVAKSQHGQIDGSDFDDWGHCWMGRAVNDRERRYYLMCKLGLTVHADHSNPCPG
ncbi:hypothetical protein LTR49_025141 [Elasticomyces elasticus]|nr:hypothetical protein LTR49_025141 [Elasticomyces elasticus]